MIKLWSGFIAILEKCGKLFATRPLANTLRGNIVATGPLHQSIQPDCKCNSYCNQCENKVSITGAVTQTSKCTNFSQLASNKATTQALSVMLHKTVIVCET